MPLNGRGWRDRGQQICLESDQRIDERAEPASEQSRIFRCHAEVRSLGWYRPSRRCRSAMADPVSLGLQAASEGLNIIIAEDLDTWQMKRVIIEAAAPTRHSQPKAVPSTAQRRSDAGIAQAPRKGNAGHVTVKLLLQHSARSEAVLNVRVIGEVAEIGVQG